MKLDQLSKSAHYPTSPSAQATSKMSPHLCASGRPRDNTSSSDSEQNLRKYLESHFYKKQR
jgi:hypothetical protein